MSLLDRKKEDEKKFIIEKLGYKDVEEYDKFYDLVVDLKKIKEKNLGWKEVPHKSVYWYIPNFDSLCMTDIFQKGRVDDRFNNILPKKSIFIKGRWRFYEGNMKIKRTIQLKEKGKTRDEWYLSLGHGQRVVDEMKIYSYDQFYKLCKDPIKFMELKGQWERYESKSFSWVYQKPSKGRSKGFGTSFRFEMGPQTMRMVKRSELKLYSSHNYNT